MYWTIVHSVPDGEQVRTRISVAQDSKSDPVGEVDVWSEGDASPAEVNAALDTAATAYLSAYSDGGVASEKADAAEALADVFTTGKTSDDF